MIKVEVGGRNEGGVWEKTYLEQRNKVSTCMVKIGQEALTWRAEMKRLLRLTAGKGVSIWVKQHRLGEEQKSKYGTVWEKKKESKYNTDK
jgi:hypothetical protein